MIASKRAETRLKESDRRDDEGPYTFLDRTMQVRGRATG